MTPDHLHGVLAAAAIKRGKRVLVKPLSNRLMEGKQVIDLARKNNNVITHLIPWDSNGSMETVMAWINAGVIGNLKEVHNWTNRPVWPQYLTMPADNPPLPEGLDWDLCLGPKQSAHIIPAIQIWYSEAGMISEAVLWLIWDITVYGLFSTHCN